MKNQIKKLVVDMDIDGEVDDITYYFTDSISQLEPWGSNEFKINSPTRMALEQLESMITGAVQLYHIAQANRDKKDTE